MNLDYPQYMTKEEREFILKVWKKCKPEMKEIKFKIPIIYGTKGGI